MEAQEIVVHEIDRHLVRMVFCFFEEAFVNRIMNYSDVVDGTRSRHHRNSVTIIPG